MHTTRPMLAVIGIGAVACVFGIAIVLGGWSLFVVSLRLVVGVAFVLVLPGLAATFLVSTVHFRNRTRVGTRDRERDLDVVERAVLAVIFSVIITSSVVFIFAKYRAVLFRDPTLTPQRLAYGIIGTTVMLMLLALVRQRRIPWWTVASMIVLLASIIVLRSLGVPVTAALTAGFFSLLLAMLIVVHTRRAMLKK